MLYTRKEIKGTTKRKRVRLYKNEINWDDFAKNITIKYTKIENWAETVNTF